MGKESTWLEDVVIPANPVLKGALVADVTIIGGGLAGTLTAYLLSKVGKKIILLQKKDISNSATAYTTAWLSSVVDTDLHKLVKMYGEIGAKKVWQSGLDAIDLIEKIILEEKINCDFKRVSHHRFAMSESEMNNLRKENEFAKKLGFKVILHDSEFLNFPNYGSLEIPAQAKFHPIKFLIGLRTACLKRGVQIYENSPALSIEKTSPDKNIIVFTASGLIRAPYCVITTHNPFNKPRELFAHKAIYTSYVIEALIPLGTIPEGLYEDENNPYHYFRIDNLKDNARIILGGEDHRKEISIPEFKNFRSLIFYLKKLFPDVNYEIKKKWSGKIIETIDGLPYIGAYSKLTPNILVATGFSGNGMTYSAVSAKIISDALLKKENPYAQIYYAGRKTRIFNFIEKFIDFTGEFFGGAVKNFFKF